MRLDVTTHIRLLFSINCTSNGIRECKELFITSSLFLGESVSLFKFQIIMHAMLLQLSNYHFPKFVSVIYLK